MREKDLKVVGEPSVDDLKFGEDESIDVTFALEVAPEFELSRVAFESFQVILAWESVGLWCGAAMILGVVSPVFNGFRGTSGLAAATAMSAADIGARAL